MKGKLHFFLLVFLISIVNSTAQDVILEFNGKLTDTGAAIDLSTVTIENLTKNLKIDLPSPFTTNLSGTASTGDVTSTGLQSGFKAIYPNPFKDQLNIQFFASGNGTTRVAVYNLLGQEIDAITKNLSQGVHELKYSTTTEGLYFIKLQDGEETYTQKVIANGASGDDLLDYSGFIQPTDLAKNENSFNNLLFEVGDLLRYTATAGNLRASIYDSPSASKTYTFDFTGDFYRLDSYLIQEEYPAFVNVLFSVTDINNVGVDYLETEDFEVFENDSPVPGSESAQYVRKLDQVPYIQRTVIMLDKSRSVSDDLPAIQQAAITLINTIEDGQLISVYSFAGQAELLQEFTSNKQALIDAVNSIEANGASTNLYGSILTGLESFNNLYTLDSIEEGYMVVLTDGDDTAGSNTVQQVVASRGNRRIFMVGLGNDLTPEPLNQISNPGNYIPVSNIDNLGAIFEQINLDIIRFSNSFYYLNYLSPKRNSVNDLRLEVKVNDNSGSDSFIEGEFNATDFIDVVEGVYVNVEPGFPYGPESFEYKVENSDNPLNFILDLKADTYFASAVPKYKWEIISEDYDTNGFDSNSLLFLPDTTDNSKRQLVFNISQRGIATIKISDENNNYSNEYQIIISDNAPIVITKEIDANTISGDAHAAEASGFVNDQGSSPVTSFGVVFKAVDGSKFSFEQTVDLGGSSNNFFNGLIGLRANVQYEVRAFARNNEGIGYGNKVFFTALPGTALLGNTLNAPEDFRSTRARIFTSIFDDGGSPITQKGYYYSSTEEVPDMDDNVILDNELVSDDQPISDIDLFIEDLIPETTYFFRAFAINDRGIKYGEPISFTTESGIPTFISESVANITSSSADRRFTVQKNGAIIEEIGACYSLSPNPTIEDDKILLTPLFDGPLTRVANININNLESNTTYYSRGYTITNDGVYYSTEITFKTLTQ